MNQKSSYKIKIHQNHRTPTTKTFFQDLLKPRSKKEMKI